MVSLREWLILWAVKRFLPAKFVPENSFLKSGVGLKLRGVLTSSNAIYKYIYIVPKLRTRSDLILQILAT